MADALVRLLDDDTLRARLGMAAAARYTRDFTANAMASRYMAIYDELATRHTRVRRLHGLRNG
jgi:glycosyltransferase involved in cell wall biosynthesis